MRFNTSKGGNKPVRLTVSVLANRKGQFYTVRTDVPNRRVTTIASNGRKTIRRFESNGEVRAYSDATIARQRHAGYV